MYKIFISHDESRASMAETMAFSDVIIRYDKKKQAQDACKLHFNDDFICSWLMSHKCSFFTNY